MAQGVLFLATFYAALLTSGVSGQSTSLAPGASQPPEPDRSNCPDKCGDVHIPYPFGVGPRPCSMAPEFELTCNETTSPPSLFTGTIKVASITLETAKMVVYSYLTYTCTVPSGNNGGCNSFRRNMSIKLIAPYLVSPTDNVFMSLGCNSLARIKGQSQTHYLTGCITTCGSVNDTEDGTPCSGQGCCEASITPGLQNVSVAWKEDDRMWCDSPVPDSPCQYAFVATKGWYNFSRKDLIGNMTFANRLGGDSGAVVPVVLDWAIKDGACPPSPQADGDETHPYGACLSTQSYCVNASNRETGYFCNCSTGYTGNPYRKEGCMNIDECALRRSSTMYENMYPCRGGTCHDSEGDYVCKCNFGRRGDGKSDEGCEPVLPKAAVAVIGTISCIAVVAVLLTFLRAEQEKRKLRDRFNKNGGQLLKSIKINIFTKEKLDDITNNYRYIIGRGAFGQIYKGTIGEGHNVAHVAVKRSIAITEDWQKESFANEITIQSQIRHRNLVRLLGCCLETEVPMLVYEFVARGSLQDVLHGNNDPLPLKTRLNIAIYSAVALVYMHSEASQNTIVLHGDVKSGNILLDEDFTPKVTSGRPSSCPWTRTTPTGWSGTAGTWTPCT